MNPKQHKRFWSRQQILDAVEKLKERAIKGSERANAMDLETDTIRNEGCEDAGLLTDRRKKANDIRSAAQRAMTQADNLGREKLGEFDTIPLPVFQNDLSFATVSRNLKKK